MWFNRLTHLLSGHIAVLGSIVIIGLMTICVFKISTMIWLNKRKIMFLELTAAVPISQKSDITKQLFAAIHDLQLARPLKDRLLRKDIVIAAEIVVSQASAACYIIQIPDSMICQLEQIFSRYLPDIKVGFASEELVYNSRARYVQVNSLRQKRHYSFPIPQQMYLGYYDPIAYLTAAANTLSANETIQFQLVLTPVKQRKASTLSVEMLKHEDKLPRNTRRTFAIWSWFCNFVAFISMGIVDATSDVYFSSSRPNRVRTSSISTNHYQLPPKHTHANHRHAMSTSEEQLIDSVNVKLNQPLFQVALRVQICTNTSREAKDRFGELKASLSSSTICSSMVSKISAIHVYASTTELAIP
jgi:hypothetical protein